MVALCNCLIWPFLMIMVLHGVAIFLFTRGFLLTRTELPHFSTCSDISDSPCFSPSSFSPNLNQTHLKQHQCWTKPIVNRLVIIVLDALRFDFVAPSACFEEKKPWMDNLPVLQKLASTKGSLAKIFKAISDPPTTSLQRLKGLTTGGLPTFIDVGNSFGAPAIVEDNLIYQLVQNGKRVVMMGDDTWLQLFPHHFEKSYPFPSFNVKDLHTVDNGCIDHLLPSLYEEDWDVLIAHFLGVDHAGHIFGVDSTPMIEKLEQYNGVLENIIEVLESQSGPGGLHENTFLLVMGDHGQTLNGDHGGGTAEEVETSIFAMSLKKTPSSLTPELNASCCEPHLDKEKMCINSIQQLDFAVTISAMLGIPFPFGSIGRVDSELYALGSGTLNLESINVGTCRTQWNIQSWMRDYVNVLCINSWQVKRYIDAYSASSVIGFSSEDILHITDIYAQAEESWSHTIKNWLLDKNESCDTILPFKSQIDAYSNFLASVAELARSKWTEFDLKMMGVGLGIMLISLVIQFLGIKRINRTCGVYFPFPGDSWTSFGLILSIFIVMIRACSFLSNSYILEEGKVAIFLLATTGILKFRNSILKNKMLLEAVVFLLLVFILRLAIEIGLSKQAFSSGLTTIPVWMYIAEIVPVLALVLLAYLLYRNIDDRACWLQKFVISGTILSYALIAVHWTVESKLVSTSLMLQGFGKGFIPRIIYAIGIGQLLMLALGRLSGKERALDSRKGLILKVVAVLSSWSSTVIMISGKQGPLVALASIIGGWCMMRLENLEHESKNGSIGTLSLSPLSVTQWSLLAVSLFFCTGHWCAFDGLRYGAAFVGFEDFILVRQAILLTIDTFGFSLLLPIFGLPFLVARQYPSVQSNQRKRFIFAQLSQAYLIYGLITATTVTFTVICVTIQRRHLMVWGLFAPKFVFDVVGLLLSDCLILLSSLYYFS